MSRFNPGDEIICRDVVGLNAEYLADIKINETYIVHAVMEGEHTGEAVSLEGLPEEAWFTAERFYLVTKANPDRVADIINERAGQWGDAESTHARIGDVWSGILGIDVNARQVALCMAGLKLVRAEINPGNEDSYVDGHAYLKFAEDFAQ